MGALTPEPLDGTGERWWRWHGHDVDLQAEPGHVPMFVRVGVLAHRDALTAEDADMADFLAWLVAEHPPWTGGCTTCRTAGQCAVQDHAAVPVTSWLIDRTQRMMSDPTARNTRVPG